MARSTKYKDFIEECQIMTIAERFRPVEGPYAVSIIAERPDKRRRDIDNLIAPVMDALMHSAVTPDDSLCQWVYASWDDAKPNIPIVRVTLK
jgi:Holliday junction resolvase RusA-like endonuclease